MPKLTQKTLLAYGSGEVAEDSSANGNDGELKVGPKWVDGKFGKALEFDGVDDYAGRRMQKRRVVACNDGAVL